MVKPCRANPVNPTCQNPTYISHEALSSFDTTLFLIEQSVEQQQQTAAHFKMQCKLCAHDHA